MRLVFVLSFFLYFVALLIQNKICNGCIEKERMGLLEIKAYFIAQGGDPIGELDSWVDDRSSNCCYWKRVKCSNISTGHVTELSLHELMAITRILNVSLFGPFEELLNLDLSSNGFEGLIGDGGFQRLKKLETLNLSHNILNSSILPSLNGLTSLKALKLAAVNMVDFFSVQDFVNLTRLELLDLKFNDLEGSLDAGGLEKLKSLKVLDLGDNSLNGSIEGICVMKDLIELGLCYNQFSGRIPECLGKLRNLQVLDLSENMFSGNFPSFTSNLTSLVYLSLFDNYLQGSFSLSTLANHSKLQILYISSQSPIAKVETEKTQWFPTFQLKAIILQSCNLNMEKGRIIPSFLLHQKDLQFIDLSHNRLVGAFPSWLIQNNSRLHTLKLSNNSFVGNLLISSTRKNLYQLDISKNNISGLLLKDIGILLPGIKVLNLSMNNFEGKVPASIGKMQQLILLDLSHNRFFGELPEQLATKCINLQHLKLSNNFLQGNIVKFSNLTNLSWLYLNNNNLYGTLKEVLESLNSKVLQTLDISNNSISGEIPGLIGKFSSLEVLLMAENQLEGEIPFAFSNLSSLYMLDLSQNRLLGSVSYIKLSYMSFLYLQKNAFSGSIPFTLSEGSSLVTLDLRDNNFSGSIPHSMNKLSNLRVLSLGGNNFHGQIPIQICQLKEITIMDLSRNKINGSIPSCLKNLSFGTTENDYHGMLFQLQSTFRFRLSGSFLNTNVRLFMGADDLYWDNEVITAVEFRTKTNYYSYKGNFLEIMTGLDLSCNMLTGIIPSQIGNMQQIHALNLSHNYLSGSIPNTFSNLTQIESLDLSYNNLSGEIPFQLIQLYFLSIFNVSYNNLSGTPPTTGQFGDFDEDNYRGNPGLCGPLLKQKCESVATSPSSESNNTGGKETIVDMEAFRWSFCASYITILLWFIMVLCINAHWRMALFYYMSKFIRTCFPSFPLY